MYKIFQLTLATFYSLYSFNAQVTDIEGNVYPTKKIGTQIWMTENLKTTKFRNGDPIMQMPGSGEKYWGRDTRDKYLDFIIDEGENQPGYFSVKSGIPNILYNGSAVKDTRGVCPEGWRIPTIIDWHLLMIHNGGWHEDQDIPCEKSINDKLKAQKSWAFSQSNSTGFSAKPNNVLSPYGTLEAADDFKSWAGDRDLENNILYLVHITQYQCHDIYPQLTSSITAMPCRCVKGVESPKWEDLTSEQQSQFPSVSFLFEHKNRELRKRVGERISDLMRSKEVEQAAKLYSSQMYFKDAITEDLIMTALKEKKLGEVIIIDDSNSNTYIQENKQEIIKLENGNYLLSFDIDGTAINTELDLPKLNPEIFMKNVYGFEIPFKSKMDLVIDRKIELINSEYVSGYKKLLFYKGDEIFKSANDLPDLKFTFDESVSQNEVQKKEKFKVSVLANGQIVEVIETIKVTKIKIKGKP